MSKRFPTAPRDAGQHGVALRDCLLANYERLHRRLLRYLGCPEQARDSLHDAWLRLGEAALPAAVQSPEAYVYRVACNLAMDQLRQRRAGQYVGEAEAELDVLADAAPGPEGIAEVRSELAALGRALERLPRRHQDVLLSLRLNELTRQQVAARHGISLRSVDTVLRQALDHCAEHTGWRVGGGVAAPRRPLARAAGWPRQAALPA
ncbi:sigma-70 family RNA polymerase sigma factor [Janthinobacterium fluminis]|uniref:Sigma-70 family RNA polymerase sigma factor n=1 Tax=Janthinobacterium fluminis TaxID=2987524 RepID=A0ABT5JY46_9BURK|nr:sigma-70 family RNA polymerase sigma factor [Janthinobacterium fluminis]MDC8757658.1 sigma-70 family RNA polymerase sigma factor [Janthinobacterium fluminis]